MHFQETEIKETLKNWGSIVRKYQQPDVRKAAVQIVNSFLPFLGLWVLMYFSLDWHYGITLALAAVNAFFLVRIFIIQHDCGHMSFFKSRKWNESVGFACSFFSTLPFKYWAHMHDIHHSHTGQYEMREIGDIKFLTTEEFKNRSPWQRFTYRVFRNPLVLFGIAPISYFTILNRVPMHRRDFKKVGWQQISNNLLILGVYALLAYFLGWKQFLLVHIPVVFLFSVIAFWFFYVQHQHDDSYKSDRAHWDYLMASIVGSTYYKLPKVMMWLTGNIGLHHIHHLSCRIPNYCLQKCADENPVLNKYVTIINFRQSLKYMHNKLWDEQRQRMITFKEFYRMERSGKV